MSKLPSRYTLLELLTRALPYLQTLEEDDDAGPSDGGELKTLIEDIREVTEI
jgi:hypothetical protein